MRGDPVVEMAFLLESLRWRAALKGNRGEGHSSLADSEGGLIESIDKIERIEREAWGIARHWQEIFDSEAIPRPESAQEPIAELGGLRVGLNLPANLHRLPGYASRFDGDCWVLVRRWQARLEGHGAFMSEPREVVAP